MAFLLLNLTYQQLTTNNGIAVTFLKSTNSLRKATAMPVNVSIQPSAKGLWPRYANSRQLILFKSCSV
ncbi:hypothetical protein [Moorena bouillonii]|uniref:hypothetical protein n=1 Tax=Moorena bouillonii TaxID=207920 RepID=UPI00117F7E0B|nr:hypothetical protein [Moorena bouillonii]